MEENIVLKTNKNKLDRWFSNEEHIMLSHRPRVPPQPLYKHHASYNCNSEALSQPPRVLYTCNIHSHKHLHINKNGVLGLK